MLADAVSKNKGLDVVSGYGKTGNTALHCRLRDFLGRYAAEVGGAPIRQTDGIV